MEGIADNHDVTVAEVALAWVRVQSGITSTIIGAKNMKQLKSNLSSVNIEFSNDELNKLDEVSATADRYPFWMVDRQDADRTLKGKQG